MDVVFVHGLCGGPFKTWRVADDSKKEGSRCWPEIYLGKDLPSARTLTVKYKVNLVFPGFPESFKGFRRVVCGYVVCGI